MLKKIKSKLLLLSLPAAYILVGSNALALDSSAESGFNKGIKKTGGTSSSDIGSTIQDVVGILLFIAGVICVLIIVIAGFRYVMSNGDPTSAGKAKNTIVYALVGLVIAVMSYAIVNFVLVNIKVT